MFFILCIALISKQLFWIFSIPLWHFPDEQAHFAQVQNSAEKNNIHPTNRLSTSQEIFESERLLGTDRDVAGNNKFTYHPEYFIEYSENITGVHEERIKNFPKEYRSTLVINEATGYPPLYYNLSAVFYAAAYESDLISRVFATRFINLFLFALFAYVVYKTAVLLFPKDVLLQTTLVIVTTFHPMLSFIFAGVNSDNLFNLLFAFGIFHSLKMLQNGVKRYDLFLVLLTLITSSYIKPQGFLLTSVYLFPLAWHVWKSQHKKVYAGMFFAVIFVGVGFIFYKLFTGQQILPQLPSTQNFPSVSLMDYINHLKSSLIFSYRQTLPWYWGVFRWLSLTYPRIIHRGLNILTVLSIMGLAVYCFKYFRKKTIPITPKLVLFFVYTNLIYFLAIVTFDYVFTRFNGFSFGIQGRYFFPVILAQMALFIIGIYTLVWEFKYKRVLVKAIGAVFIALHTYAWIFVSTSYYNNATLLELFTQMSQYRPWFFKVPFLYFWFLVGIVFQIIFVHKYLRLKKDDYEKN